MATERKDGGPAYPHCFEDMTGHPQFSVSSGMSLRDWFAGQAIQAIIRNGGLHWHDSELEADECRSDSARRAYATADAMLSAREGK